MIATISFGSMVEWVIGAFIVGLMAGASLFLYLATRSRKK